MKLDKRACRHASNVPLHISLNAGVLYTERVKYLVTAAVKLLGGHRVLTVYFYDCERLKTNDRILRVEKQDVSVLREQKTGVSLLKKYQAYVAIHLRGRAELFQWQLHNEVSEIPTDIFQYMTAEKFMRYIDAQFPIYCETRPANGYRDPTMETLVITYVDYLHMCRRQAYDMKDKSVLFPKNCAAAHDREVERIQKINDAQKNRAFGRAYAGFARKAVISNEELQIVCPKRTNDLVAEGRALHHCVGSYIDRVAEGEVA